MAHPSQDRDPPSQEYLRRIFYYEEVEVDGKTYGWLFWKRREDMSPQWNSRHAEHVAGGYRDHGPHRIYQCVWLDGHNQVLHRLIWIYHYGAIPKGYDVHHINEDKNDNRIENLQLVEWIEHRQHHGAKQIAK